MALLRFLAVTLLLGSAAAQYRWQAGLNLGDLARFTSSLEASLGHLADTIEQEVESSLPLWMRQGGAQRRRDQPRPLPFDQGMEAISGTIGGAEGVDDGLRVHMDGDFDGVKVEEMPEVEEEEVEAARPAPPPEPIRPIFDFDGSLNLFRPFKNNMFDRPLNWMELANRRRQWWKGPNVCVDQEEIDEGNGSASSSPSSSHASFVFSFAQMEVTTCQEETAKYSCTTKTSKRGINKTVRLTYRCCHGYTKDDTGCARVVLRELPDTLQAIGATDFLSLTKSVGVERTLLDNVTLFVPTNEAMQEFTAELEEENELNNNLNEARTLNEVYEASRRSLDTAGIVQAHVTSGVHYTSSLADEQILESADGKSSLRINTYSTTPATSTVNCARLVTTNHHTSSGVVHTIDRVLRPVTSTLADIIAQDPQFSVLNKLLSQADMTEQLMKPGQLTVFAPTNQAFAELPESVLTSLLEGNACLETVVKNHILPNVICSAAVQGKARTVNLLDTYLNLHKTDEDLILVGDAQIIQGDVMATNGVLHVIDGTLMPQEAKPLWEVLEGHNLTRFLELIEAAGMTGDLNTLSDVTVFAPSNRAIDEIPAEVLADIKSDKKRLREIIEYHFATPSLKAGDVSNNHMTDTRANHPLRINLYTRSPLLAGLVGGGRRSHHHMRMTAGCSPVSMLDSRACGAVVHVLEKLLVLPRPSVMDLLEADKDFSIFTKIVKNTGLNETLSSEGPFTVLAPSDHVFRILPEAELDMLMEDAALQEQLVAQHVLEEHVCCSGINSNTWLFMDHKRTLSGAPIHVRRTNRGRLMAGPARITHCSSPTHNGLVHTVNHLLMNIHPQGHDQDQRRPVFSTPGLEVLFG